MATEKQLIRGDVAEQRLSKLAEHYKGSFSGEAFERAAWEIANMPRVDAVEVVRCKDCKHWHEETGWCNQHSHFIGANGEACHPWESTDWKTLNEDDFCSYGERNGNERKAD